MKLIKGRWFPLTVSFAIAIVVAFVMGLCGWRVTYAPELETSWDAISAIAALAGVFTSFGAIMVAVRIPKRIADRQDKIALFEKRIDCFSFLCDQRQLYFTIKDRIDIEEIRKGIAMLYGTDSLCDFMSINFKVLTDKVIKQYTQMSFLFEGIDYQEANQLGLSFIALVTALLSDDCIRIKTAKKKYEEKLDDFVECHIEEMSKCLSIRKL